MTEGQELRKRLARHARRRAVERQDELARRQFEIEFHRQGAKAVIERRRRKRLAEFLAPPESK